jgi:hypothetical protein
VSHAVWGWPDRRREHNVTRFIVHIGPHKTGTTYLQVMLESLRGSLSERGICIPSVWNSAPGFPSHMQLVLALRCGDLTLVREQLQDILALRPRYVVISCEALSRLTLEQIVQLRQLLGSAPVEVVYYIRRWPERLPSLWRETVKFGHAATFPEFLTEQLTDYAGSELRDTVMIDKFVAVFGANHVKIVSYSHLVDGHIDIARHFLTELLGLPQVEPLRSDRLNRSLSIFETELIRALNTIHLGCGGEPTPELRTWFLGHKDTLVPAFVRDAMHKSLGTIRLDEAAPPWTATLQDLLKRYAPSIVRPHHADGLHALRSIDTSFVQPNYLLMPSVTNALNDIYEAYSRAHQPAS